MTLLVTSLASSSDGNALLLRHHRHALLVDCGLPLRQLEPLLRYAGVHPADLTAVLLTHEHGDHTVGVGALARRYGVPVVCNSDTRAALDKQLKNAAIEELPTGQPAALGSFEVRSFPVAHDAAAPVSYTIAAGGATVGIAVDLGSWNAALVEHLRPADLLIVEANHHKARLLASAYPWVLCQRIAGPLGHLDNQQAGHLLAEIGADGRQRQVWLAHLSQHTNQPLQALQQVRQVLAEASLTNLRASVLARQAFPTRKGMPFWSSDTMFRQIELW